MADEFELGSGNWWNTNTNNNNSTGRSRFDGGGSSTPASSTTLNSLAGSFGWTATNTSTNTSSSMDSLSVSGSSMTFPDSSSQKLHGHDQSSSSGGVLSDPNLHLMNLALSSPSMDWNNPPLFRGDKAENSFRSMLQEELSSNESSVNEFKQMNRGFSLDQFSASNNENSGTSFSMDHSGYGLLGADNTNYCYQSGSASYGLNQAAAGEFMGSSSNNWPKFPHHQFLRPTPPKLQPQHQLHFTNNTPFWNASTTAGMNDARTSFFPPPLDQTQIPTPSYEEKPKNTTEVRDLKKTSSETSSNKRPRNETPSPLPAFKVRKEKMGDRITALQQLVSPFGKTDTASVLSEVIEYIKFLHDQISMLITPYMKSGTPPIQSQLQQQNNSEKSKDPEGSRQDLRSRGLCLVPVSSTFPVTHETTVDFWTPTFGGTFR